MNWLAHLYLSKPTPAFRLGNLLPDLASAAALVDLPPEFQAGIQCHRRIDAFTDSHPVFRRSIERLGPPFRRFGGVLIDIFYDHILAREWQSFANQPLAEFAAEVYASFNAQWSHVPAEARPRLQAMCEADWIGSYRHIEGITEALTRIGERLRRPTDLAASVPILVREYEAFRDDFGEFFPQLIAHVGAVTRPPTPDPTVTSLATRYWAAELGCAPDELFAEPFRLVTHRGQFADYHGVFALFRDDAAIVSVPSRHAATLRPMLAHLTGGCSPDALAAALEPISKTVIGPAYLGYTLNIVPPVHPARALNSGDLHATEEMQRSSDPVEWELGGSSIDNPCSGVFVDGQLAALAGYETWGNRIAHISVISHPAWRGRGYAGSAVAHLGQRALTAGLLPQYRTLEANLPCVHIAQSLGFQPYARSLAIRLKEDI